MGLHVRHVIREGLSRGTARSGIILMILFFLTTAVQTTFVWLATSTYLPLGTVATPPAAAGADLPLAGTELPNALAFQASVVASFAGGLVTIPVQVVAHRTLVSDWRTKIPEEYVLYRLGRATLHLLVGSWVVFVLGALIFLLSAGIGIAGAVTVMTVMASDWLVASWPGRALVVVSSLVLLLPTVLFGIGIVFFSQEIAVRDKGVRDALVESWRLTRGHRLRLGVLIVGPLLLHGLLGTVLSLLLTDALSQIVVVAETAVGTVLIQGIMAVAYLEVSGIDPASELTTRRTDAG
ncbi:hypothetical protein C440_04418 [Haloferax mucosum ATCC BAA-1512]|uniref:DUF7847 domain-containing protein n=1 Tax=Haloferax mucosum ATCC BAA-1512 TaxID=662479 RepID=M0IJM8_9EURY|nr:hypothetical protein [Haloferax mucosum]ELZ96991.1 hypothetical protein C440_04418 [Haloferax mucosum ATCC BAA-1512]